MWTSYLKCMSSSGLYDLRSREKRRGGVCSRLISCLMGRHLAVIRTEGAALGAHLPPEASSTHPQGPPALCWALLHSWRDSAFWAACFAPVWVSCHSKRMAYSPFVCLSDTAWQVGGQLLPLPHCTKCKARSREPAAQSVGSVCSLRILKVTPIWHFGLAKIITPYCL